jgi:hypothetical protein
LYHLKFYADCPENGPVNKLFCYPVHDGKHACDLLAKFLAKSYRLRAAFLGEPGEKGKPLPPPAIQFPSAVQVASKLLVQYPRRVDATTVLSTFELDELSAKYPHLRGVIKLLRGV